MGLAAMSDEKFIGTVLEAKAYALRMMSGDVYTISIEDKTNKRVFHYGYTGVDMGQNRA